EARNPPQLRRGDGHLRLRQHLHHPLHQAQPADRPLRRLPPLLHRGAADRRQRRPGRALHEADGERGRHRPPPVQAQAADRGADCAPAGPGRGGGRDRGGQPRGHAGGRPGV
ncbi:MAG: LSU ribosomal protein L31p @ LSU ribosomal protein L31p, zinc-dependent, partial [uncultured Thermomicrobiales bacterium]